MALSNSVRPGDSPEAIQTWLIARIAEFLGLPPEHIEPDVSLADYGLESVYAFALCGEIEDTLGAVIEPTLLWDTDTVSALTAHLVSQFAENGPVAGGDR
ncbi:acyl carrier protein [Streptomyces sp. NPDC088350]|uniref:acyl carrier protein n=1 Tax=Streptomyces sp. NPDC088350 TaxID=3365854 RepID=UPI00382025B9